MFHECSPQTLCSVLLDRPDRRGEASTRIVLNPSCAILGWCPGSAVLSELDGGDEAGMSLLWPFSEAAAAESAVMMIRLLPTRASNSQFST